MDSLYPAGPQAVPTSLAQPSKQYRQRAWWAVASLLLFAVIYFALLAWFGRTAWRLFDAGMNSDHGLMFLLMSVCSGFLALFMAKALFFVRRGGTPDDIELKPADQPRLFAFLHQLADEAGAPRPARVFISARVNAAVFYDLSILNFIFPSRKNLEIGLALVNVLSLSEIKAVLAHEFGHFAQRSMAIGSWVYVAQQIAAHVIAKRDALDRFLQVLSGLDVRVAWVGWVLRLIVWSIRSLMDTVFRLVVLAQRALSRQMEFQADLVAVSMTGSDELIHALHKLQAADEAWSRTLTFANAESGQGRAVKDLFAVQSAVLEKMARILDDEDYGRVPASQAREPAQRRVFTKGFAQPPQMWSTHPDNADREANAKRQYLAAPHDARSAWCIFSNPEALREKVSAHLVKEMKLEVVEATVTMQQLDERYSLLQYQPSYRGVYLGRTLARHYKEPRELYEAVALAHDDVAEAIAALYPESLKGELEQLRALEEERALLVALRDKVYKATGGQLMHRGEAISRKQLPDAIRQVGEEAEAVRGRILTHDRQCRAAHLAAARRLGGRWPEYLQGLVAVLHYAEHTLANVQDMHGLLRNVVAVVTADGNVSASELQRLLDVANELQRLLAAVYAQRNELVLDTSLTGRLKCATWADMLEEFKLPPANRDNVNDWMRAIDGWVNALTGALSSMASATLEQLLTSEAQVAQLLSAEAVPEAPHPSQVPAQYGRLIPGEERKRQQQLGAWDRFQTADGLWAAALRLLVAGGIVGAVLGVGSSAGSFATVTVYNGLGTEVRVRVGDEKLTLQPFGTQSVDLPFQESVKVEARNREGALIESMDGQLVRSEPHYVYNVAGASPLVRWTAMYVAGKAPEPIVLGTMQWRPVDVDLYFEEPPERISSKSGSMRTVVSGAGERDPRDLMRVTTDPAQRVAMVHAHARWDDATTGHAREWKALDEMISSRH